MFYYVHTFIMFINLESIFEYIRQKLKKLAYFKISSWDEVFIRLVFFFTFRYEISSLSFWQGWTHPGMNFERVNSNRHFTIDRDVFIPRRVSPRDEISRVNNLYEALYILYFWLFFVFCFSLIFLLFIYACKFTPIN